MTEHTKDRLRIISAHAIGFCVGVSMTYLFRYLLDLSLPESLTEWGLEVLLVLLIVFGIMSAIHWWIGMRNTP